MTNTERTTNLIAGLLERGGIITEIETRTPNRRLWQIAAAEGGRYWLYELDPHGRREPEEHDAPDGDGWSLAGLLEYLGEVGRAG